VFTVLADYSKLNLNDSNMLEVCISYNTMDDGSHIQITQIKQINLQLQSILAANFMICICICNYNFNQVWTTFLY